MSAAQGIPIITRGNVRKAIASAKENIEKENQAKSRDAFCEGIYSPWLYVRLFYGALILTIYELVLDDAKGFYDTLVGTMKRTIGKLRDAINSDKLKPKEKDGKLERCDLNVLTFSERVIALKLDNNMFLEEKLGMFLTHIDKIDNELRKGRTEFLKLLTHSIEKFNADCDNVNLVIQILLDSIGFAHEGMVKETEARLIRWVGNDIYVKEWAIRENNEFVVGIRGETKTWFGDCADKKKRKEHQDNCEEFNKRVCDRLKNREAIKNIYDDFGFVVEYKVAYYPPSIAKLNDGDFKKVIERDEIKVKDGNQFRLKRGSITIAPKKDRKAYPDPFSNFKNKEGVRYCSPINGICSAPTVFGRFYWQRAYVKGATLVVFPSSILDRFDTISDDFAKKLPKAFQPIHSVIGEKYANLKKSGHNRIGKSIEMSRVLKYFDTGRAPIDMDLDDLNKILDCLRIAKAEIQDGDNVREKLVKHWEEHIKDKGLLDVVEGGLTKDDLKNLCDEVSPELMCPFFSIPFTEIAAEPLVKAGSDIWRLAKLEGKEIRNRSSETQHEQKAADEDSKQEDTLSTSIPQDTLAQGNKEETTENAVSGVQTVQATDTRNDSRKDIEILKRSEYTKDHYEFLVREKAEVPILKSSDINDYIAIMLWFNDVRMSIYNLECGMKGKPGVKELKKRTAEECCAISKTLVEIKGLIPPGQRP